MNTLQYFVAADKMELQEDMRDEDIEIIIKIKRPEIQKILHQIRQHFESDEVYTDILFYTFKDHTQIIVKKESYVPFVLELFKWELLEKIQWNK